MHYGFEPLNLLYRQNFLILWCEGKKTKLKKFLHKNISNTQVTTQNFSSGEFYKVRFDLCKFNEKYHYLATTVHHRLKVWDMVSDYDNSTYYLSEITLMHS